MSTSPVVTPSVASDGGERWKAALILLAPIRACLTAAETTLLFQMIRSSTDYELGQALASMEAPNALTVSAALSTRKGGEPGMNEAQSVVKLSARYLDTNSIMPPEVAKYTPGWLGRAVTAIPGGQTLEGWRNRVMDAWDDVGLRESPEYSTDSPPSPLTGPGAAGYRSGLYEALTVNIIPEQ